MSTVAQLASQGVYLPAKPTDTQLDAGEAAATAAPVARERVLEALRQARLAGDIGLTDTEIARVTGLYLNTAAPSRFALVKRGLVRDSGERRVNARGRKMIVWQEVTD